MENIEIISSGIYLPSLKIDNETLAKELNISQDYIYKRCGIKTRYFKKEETIERMAINATQNALSKTELDKNKIDMIIVATTTTNKLMPGISFLIQKHLNIQKCMCLDILAGCSGYINAFDIARNYIAIGKVNYALVIGVDVLSEYTQKDDVSTRILLSDGAGAILIGKIDKEKKYISLIESDGMNGDILECISNKNIQMDGTAIYRYAVTDTIKNIEELLRESKEKLEDIKYVVPHQSNVKIMNSMAKRLEVEEEKIYKNLEHVGNTFSASIPIAINEMLEKKLITQKDKIILLGYGGGLNLGSILIEI